MRVLFLAAVIFLAGCATERARIEHPISRVGLVLHTNTETICYQYTGLTAFNNSIEPYKLPHGFNKVLRTSFERTFKALGVEVVDIDSSEIANSESFTTSSSWNGVQKISQNYMQTVKSIASKYKVDAVIVLDRIMNVHDDNSCVGIASVSTSNYGILFVPPEIGVFTPNGEFIRNILIYSNISEVPRAEHPEKLDEKFLENLEKLIEAAVDQEVRDMVPGKS